jgi:hypothetical protein
MTARSASDRPNRNYNRQWSQREGVRYVSRGPPPDLRLSEHTRHWLVHLLDVFVADLYLWLDGLGLAFM